MSVFLLNEDTNFERIIGVLFNNWTILKSAFENGLGGSEEVMRLKISDLIMNIHECLQKCDYSWTIISIMIEDVMDVGFNVELEDSSADDLSKLICQFFCDWNDSSDGRKKVINELKNFPIVIPIQAVPLKPIRDQLKQD